MPGSRGILKRVHGSVLPSQGNWGRVPIFIGRSRRHLEHGAVTPSTNIPSELVVKSFSAGTRACRARYVGPGAGPPERRLLNPPCLACLILVAPTSRKLFAATLRNAAGSDADASVDDTTALGASDLHGRLITSSRRSSETAPWPPSTWSTSSASRPAWRMQLGHGWRL